MTDPLLDGVDRGIAKDKQINQKFDTAVDLVPKRSPLGADILHTQR
jgi:hypothetical protein